ncbi:MAG TPA: hypothetical protein VHL09_07045 [Dehalococcoidia bacterium]|nr:hypothetical protein [Dehalococcoidia bacterium]
MARWLYLLIPMGVIALILRAVGAGPEFVFLTAAIGIIPLAGLIGVSTENLAHKIGPKWGGLLTAVVGNAGELLIGLVALRSGRMNFDAREAGRHSAMLLPTVADLLLPALFATSVHRVL